MISKNEYLFYKSKLNQLEDDLFNYQYGNPDYKMFETYSSMSEEAKSNLKIQWATYYRNILDTPIFKNFKEARLALARGDVRSVKVAVEKSKPLEITLTKPSSEDPDFLFRKLEPYRNLLTKIAKYKEILEEYNEVYESKKSNNFEPLETL